MRSRFCSQTKASFSICEMSALEEDAALCGGSLARRLAQDVRGGAARDSARKQALQTSA